MEAVMDAKPVVDRETMVPFCMRTFVKTDGGFHRPNLFEDGMAPTTDEVQIHTWRDATLREIVNSLRLHSTSAEIKHPLSKFSFRAVYADASARGRYVTRDMGSVMARELLGPVGSVDAPAARLVSDADDDLPVPEEGSRSVAGKTLEELRFIPGDYLYVSVQLPKHLTQHNDVSIRGAAGSGPPGANGWKSARPLEPIGPPGGLGRGGGHWRGASEPGAGRGRGGRSDFPPRREREFGGREREFEDRRPPPPRRPRGSPERNPYTGRGRRSPSYTRSRSRSMSPRRRFRD